jgi:hypothetical protein
VQTNQFMLLDQSAVMYDTAPRSLIHRFSMTRLPISYLLTSIKACALQTSYTVYRTMYQLHFSDFKLVKMYENKGGTITFIEKTLYQLTVYTLIGFQQVW